MKSLIQATKLYLAERRVRRNARRIAIKMYTDSKATKAQRQRYVRGQVALWKEAQNDR